MPNNGSSDTVAMLFFLQDLPEPNHLNRTPEHPHYNFSFGIRSNLVLSIGKLDLFLKYPPPNFTDATNKLTLQKEFIQ